MALLDQRLIAGLGNIYVCEALHRAGLSPRRAAGSIAGRDGGTFQHGFRAYDREGQACLTASCRGTSGRIVQSGRSTFFCAQCQT